MPNKNQHVLFCPDTWGILNTIDAGERIRRRGYKSCFTMNRRFPHERTVREWTLRIGFGVIESNVSDEARGEGGNEWTSQHIHPCALTIQAVLRTLFPRKHHVVSIRLWDGHSTVLPRGSRRYLNRSRLWGRDSSVCSWSETGDAELLLVHWNQRHTGT